MKIVNTLLLVLLLLLQYTLWHGQGGLRDRQNLQATINEQQAANARLRERNAVLEAQVLDLKGGLDAVEEQARSDMGMIKNGEVFYQITEGSAAESHKK
jgi:cell division protein FtsB